jgi:hypothetical protein
MKPATRTHPLALFIACAAFFVCPSAAISEEFGQPPVWPDDVKAIFLKDAREALSGPPPTDIKESALAAKNPRGAVSDANWPELIDDETLTTEVKRIVNNLATLAKNPAQFKASKYQDCRRELTMLAALFGVVRDYPGEVRWKTSAATMEQRCVRAAELCTNGTTESFNAAKETHALLEELLRGQAVQPEENSSTGFPAFAPLMQRMEISLQKSLPDALKNERIFRKFSMDVTQEAQLLAMLSQAIRRDVYGYADDETYLDHADGLRKAATQLNEAASTQDFAKAVKTAAAITQSCARCHADYRG